jgi:hypothetical protein
MEEVPFGVEGYDDDVDGSRVKYNMEVFGREVRSGSTARYKGNTTETKTTIAISNTSTALAREYRLAVLQLHVGT